MDISLPEDLRDSLDSAVEQGQFRSVDEAMIAAARLLVEHLTASDPEPTVSDPFIGSMRDCADQLDEIVADAYQRRDSEIWRDVAGA